MPIVIGANNTTVSNNVITTRLIGIQYYEDISDSKVVGNHITDDTGFYGNGISFEYGNAEFNKITGNYIGNFLGGILFNNGN